MALFDHVIESAKIGLRKPDPRIYRMMVETLKVDPKNCVYLDDLGVNLKPAREMGMTTIKVVSARAGDRRTGSGDRTGIALGGKCRNLPRSHDETALVLCRERGQNTSKSGEFGVETRG